MLCNVCGNDQFIEMNGRAAVRCTSCSSFERTRVIKLLLDRLGLPKKGMRVLHLAPELGLARYIRGVVGEENYDARDIDLERYQNVKVTYFDLVKDVHTLPTGHFDLIIHSHVMEHLPCNVTAVLWHLHRALSETGTHVFAFPILDGHYEESLFPLSDAERHQRFGQFDHVRRFGNRDLQQSLGMLFRLPETYDLTALFSKDMLVQANIPESAWRGYNVHSVFALQKGDLLLRDEKPSVQSAMGTSSGRQVQPASLDYGPAPRTLRGLVSFLRKKLYRAY